MKILIYRIFFFVKNMTNQTNNNLKKIFRIVFPHPIDR